ncbi:Apc15p protein-domain-containing protein [Podospora aff. communis PSN243]|uniref:Apc15p protein-domain-containing protein n=1 Tax=Podospora aff. communis PSN243 TaxID=3040156 RepID=A0AAV9H650_9PEZI|nr:Apc15p protein-domain-containing protein [Podospora aff. communis PSN243]
MFSILPDLTPRDSHSLWYTSSRNPHPPILAPSHPDATTDNLPGAAHPRMRPGHPHSAAHIIERSALGRLRDDERTNDRRRGNVANLGHTWLKPPGVTKTLFQLREERREAEEHAEAMRREMLAQELAEAEAGGALPMEGGEGVLGVDGEGDEDMMEEEGARDLDDEIPDADDGGFGFDGASDEEEEDEEEENESSGGEGAGGDGRQLGRVQQREMANRVASMRAAEDRMREMMARGGNGGAAGGDLYGGDEEIDEDDHADILEEDDLVSTMYPGELEPDMDMGMDANLDDDIPEAESLGGYEHTDSEASLSSDDDAGQNISFGGMQAPRLPHIRSSMAGGAGPRSSMAGGYGQRSSIGAHGHGQRSTAGGHAPRSSLDISSILSRDGSSLMGSSSPRLRRGN